MPDACCSLRSSDKWQRFASIMQPCAPKVVGLLGILQDLLCGLCQLHSWPKLTCTPTIQVALLMLFGASLSPVLLLCADVLSGVACWICKITTSNVPFLFTRLHACWSDDVDLCLVSSLLPGYDVAAMTCNHGNADYAQSQSPPILGLPDMHSRRDTMATSLLLCWVRLAQISPSILGTPRPC